MSESVARENLILLRDVIESDKGIFFEQQLDKEANIMAGFTAKDPHDRTAFDTKWSKMQQDDSILIKTIIYQGKVAGSVLSHSWFGDPEVSYWIGKEYWGKGIATIALEQFLKINPTRPLFARVIHDNIGSIKVLEKCGFVVSGHDKGYANARGQEVDEIIYILNE
jgi:RimJ/RimL family protein N-acetyltransferase